VDDALVTALRDALAGRVDVRLAILFGSTARGTAGPGSDVDVAVLARGTDTLALARDLSRVLGREVQVVDLESVGYPMLQAIVRDGVVVAEQRRAEARWRAGARRPRQRPRVARAHARRVSRAPRRGPTGMTDRDVVAAKLADLADRVGRVRACCPGSPQELAGRDASELVAFNLMLAVQTYLDIASHIIADEGWPPASTLADAFLRLAEHRVIEAETADALGRAAAFRNVVAHGYGRVVVDLPYAAATDGRHDLEQFAGEIAAWIAPPDDA